MTYCIRCKTPYINLIKTKHVRHVLNTSDRFYYVSDAIVFTGELTEHDIIDL